MMEYWALAKSTYIQTRAIKPPAPALPEQNFRDIRVGQGTSSGGRAEGVTVYLGTTYYVPPEVFHREVLPELQKRQKESKSMYYDGPPAIGNGGLSRDIPLGPTIQRQESNTPSYAYHGGSQAICEEGYVGYEGGGDQMPPPPSAPAIHYQQVERWRFGEIGYLYAGGTAYCEWKFKEQPNECEKFRYIVNHHYLTPPPFIPPRNSPTSDPWQYAQPDQARFCAD